MLPTSFELIPKKWLTVRHHGPGPDHSHTKRVMMSEFGTYSRRAVTAWQECFRKLA